MLTYVQFGRAVPVIAAFLSGNLTPGQPAAGR